MSTSLDDLPTVQSVNNNQEQFNEQDFEVNDFIPEDADNTYKPKKVSFNEEVEYASEQSYTEQLSAMQYVYEKIKNPIVVLLIVFIFSNPTFLSMISKIPYVGNYEGTTFFSLGVATLGAILYYIITNHLV